MAKGWTADLAAEAAVRSGLPWALVSAGGDLRIAGDTTGVEVAIEDPWAATEEVARVRLVSGALASSSTTRRAWGPGLHHVIDPRTGAPSDALALQATVWAPTCAEAETLATWAILTGPAALDTIPGAIATSDGDLVDELLDGGGGRVTTWIILRAAGIGSYIALWLAVAWGLISTTSLVDQARVQADVDPLPRCRGERGPRAARDPPGRPAGRQVHAVRAAGPPDPAAGRLPDPGGVVRRARDVRDGARSW